MLRAFGARDDHRDGMIHLHADRLRGARIELPFPSVGATEQFLFAAVLAEGDSFDDHVRDTLVAGAGLCDEAATRFLQQAAARLG